MARANGTRVDGLLSFVRKHMENFKQYDRITRMSTILRRYFVMNAFDGALTIFGILIGSYVADVTDPVLVIKVGLAAAVAVGISGFSGAFFTEQAERKRELQEIEHALHRKLDKTHLQKAYYFASVITAVVDGFSPFIAALFILLPFFFYPLLESMQTAYYVSFGFSIVSFFLLGMFLGKVSRESMLATGAKLVLVGIACMLIILALT